MHNPWWIALHCGHGPLTAQEFNGLMKRVYRFRSIDHAHSFAYGCDKTHMIVMGDVDEDGGWYRVSVSAATESRIAPATNMSVSKAAAAPGRTDRKAKVPKGVSVLSPKERTERAKVAAAKRWANKLKRSGWFISNNSRPPALPDRSVRHKARGRQVWRPKRIFRRDEAVRLRAEGKSWHAIADILDVPVADRRLQGSKVKYGRKLLLVTDRVLPFLKPNFRIADKLDSIGSALSEVARYPDGVTAI